MTKKAIAIFCDYYLPSVRAGGPVRSIAGIINCLKSDFDITVITRNHDLCVTEPFNDIQSNQLLQRDGYRIYYLSSEKIISGICNILLHTHFDCVYFNSFFSPKITISPLFFIILKKIKCRIVISPRGELGVGALDIKSTRKKWYIKLFKLFLLKKVEFLAASKSEQQEIKNIFGKLAQITPLANISDQKVLDSIVNSKKKNNINIIFLSRISKKKNVLGAIEIISSVKGNVLFDIYGPIEDEPYWQSCLEKIKKLPEHIQARYCGACDPGNVTNILKNYDLFLLPTFNENYGHVIVESLSSGCPALLSNQTPWHDLMQHDAGWEYDLADPVSFSEKIDALIALSNEEFYCYKQGALNYYASHIANNALEKKYQLFFEGL